MAEQDDVRNDLQTEVFDVFGKTVTLINLGSPYYNDRSEAEGVAISSTSSIKVVPYNINHKDQNYESFGNIAIGDMFLAIPYTVSVGLEDTIVLESENWVVKQVEKNYLPDNVVTIVQVSRRLA